MNATSLIGFSILLGVVGLIVALFFQTRNAAKAYGAEMVRLGFGIVAPLPAELQKDFSHLQARQGKLMEGHEGVLFLTGSRQGTSVATAGGRVTTVDDFMGFYFAPSHALTGPRREAVLKSLPVQPLSISSPEGALFLLWQWRHTAANLRQAVWQMKTALAAVPPAIPPDPPAPASSPVPETPKDEAPPVMPDSTPAASKSVTFSNDNMWPWRKEGDPGYETLPEEALHPEIRSISLDFHVLPELTPRIGTLKKLESLWLFQTELIELPKEIGQCESLREINIRQSQLMELPDSICDLPHLEVLNLFHNELSALPARFGRLKTLRELTLNANPFLTLDESIGELENLEKLGVACYRLGALPESIKKLPRLRELVLHKEGPLASSIEIWRSALPGVEVRFADMLEITPTG